MFSCVLSLTSWILACLFDDAIADLDDEFERVPEECHNWQELDQARSQTSS